MPRRLTRAASTLQHFPIVTRIPDTRPVCRHRVQRRISVCGGNSHNEDSAVYGLWGRFIASWTVSPVMTAFDAKGRSLRSSQKENQ